MRFFFGFEQEEPNKNGAKFSTNHWLAFETLIRRYIEVSKAIKKLSIMVLPLMVQFECANQDFVLTIPASSEEFTQLHQCF